MSPTCHWQLDTTHIGRRVLVYDVTDSTSTRCAAFADDADNAGLAVLAHAQTGGRGQHDNEQDDEEPIQRRHWKNLARVDGSGHRP